MEGEETTGEEEMMEDTGNPSVEEMAEEKSEEEDVKKMEKPEEVAMKEPDGEGEEDSSLLDPVPGEEEAEEDNVGDQKEEELLREDEEVSHDEHKEVDEEKQEEKSDEDKIREFIGTDYSPEIKIEKQNLSELNIDSPKDNSMSEDDAYTIKVKCQAEADDSESYKIPSGSNSKSTKPDEGSTKIHQEESLDPVLSSNISLVYNQGEDKVMAGEEQVEAAEGGGKGEVVFLKEVKVGEGKRERRRDTREEDDQGSEGRGGHR